MTTEHPTATVARDGHKYAAASTHRRSSQQCHKYTRRTQGGGVNCTCGRETSNDAWVCEDCLDDLARDLGECTWLNDQLEVSITRQRSTGVISTPTSGDTPLPWHEKASEAKRNLHAVLSGWVRLCDEEQVRSRGGQEGWPADTIPAMSRWLMCRVDGLAFNEAGYEAVREVSTATEKARNIVFFKPAPRMYLGACDDEQCVGDVYAREGQPVGYCEVCAVAYPAEQRHQAMEDVLDDQLFTAAEIARLATYLGLEAPRERVRKVVNQWHTRSRITPAGHDATGAALFQYGQVKSLLYVAFARQAS